MPSMPAYPRHSYAGYSPVTHRVGEPSQAKAEEVDEPATVFGGMDPHFQLLLRRHGYQASPEVNVNEEKTTVVSSAYVVFATRERR